MGASVLDWVQAIGTVGITAVAGVAIELWRRAKNAELAAVREQLQTAKDLAADKLLPIIKQVREGYEEELEHWRAENKALLDELKSMKEDPLGLATATSTAELADKLQPVLDSYVTAAGRRMEAMMQSWKTAPRETTRDIDLHKMAAGLVSKAINQDDG